MQAKNLDIGIGIALFFLIFFNLFNLLGFALSTVFILILCFSTNKSTIGVFLIWLFFDVSGLWTSVFGIPNMGFLSFVTALVLFYFSKINHFINYKKAFLTFLPIILFFGLFFLLGPMHSYSIEKMIFIIYKGLFFLIAFLILLINFKIDFLKLSLLVLILAFQYYSFIGITTEWAGLAGILDFGSLRRFYSEYGYSSEDGVINYQQIGLLAVLAFSFILNIIPNSTSTKKNNCFFYIICALSLLIILYSGSRQSLYSIPIIFFLFLLYSQKLKIKTKLLMIGIGTGLFVALSLFELGREDSNLNFSEGDTIIEKLNRPYEMTHAFNLIQEKPLLGHGLGGFTPFYDHSRYYPHNIFLELLSETGIIGTLIISLFLIILSKMRGINLGHLSNSGFLIFPIFLALFIRANLSSDLIETVFVFSFLIAWCSLYSFNFKFTNNENY